MPDDINSKANISVVVDETAPDTQAMLNMLANTSPTPGAIVTFTGICRDEGGQLEALVLEHYPGMAERELTEIANAAIAKWDCDQIIVQHRHGSVEPGEVIVAVATASAHREDAFQAAHSIMDFLKTDAPFWKKEVWKDNRETSWVKAKTSDDKAKDRWKTGSKF